MNNHLLLNTNSIDTVVPFVRAVLLEYRSDTGREQLGEVGCIVPEKGELGVSS